MPYAIKSNALHFKDADGTEISTDGVSVGGESYDDTELRRRIDSLEAKAPVWDAKSNFSGNYNDLTNKPTIPTAVTDDHINGLIDAKSSNFATLDQVKAQVAESIGELDDLVTALEEVV